MPSRWCRARCATATGRASSPSAAQPRWLGADIGRRQFYRVLDAMLGAGDGHETTTGTLAPRAAIPPGAIVVAFSTLLDTDFALALIDLCRRGTSWWRSTCSTVHRSTTTDDPLIARMWSMQRAFMYRDMRTIGVDVVLWSKAGRSTTGPWTRCCTWYRGGAVGFGEEMTGCVCWLSRSAC